MEALIKLVGVDFYACDRQLLNDPEQLERAMLKAANVMEATVLKSVFTRFQPAGVSGVIIIAESHLAIHTWPEYGYAAVTFETCGSRINPWKALPALKKQLGAQRVTRFEINRGNFDVPEGCLPHKPAKAGVTDK